MAAYGFGGYLAADLWQEVQGLMNPVPPEGNAIVSTVEDLQAQTKLKVQRAAKAVDNMNHLVAIDLLTGAFWTDVRKAQDPGRTFGTAPAAALAALRKVAPLNAVLPGVMIFLTSVSFNLLSDSLRTAMDVRA